MQSIPLNRYLAQAGVCSRRNADNAIKNGQVTVDTIIVTNPAYRVALLHTICVDGIPISRQRKVYIILNKPVNYITTVSDQYNRRTVLDIMRGIPERIYPVGRLDRNTTGLLFLTNDGVLAQRLAHPRYEVQKTYDVLLAVPLTGSAYHTLSRGIILDDKRVQIDAISYDNRDEFHVQITLHSGQNRVVRRLFEAVGNRVIALKRVAYGPLTLAGLPIGRWRHLTEKEVALLYNMTNIPTLTLY